MLGLEGNLGRAPRTWLKPAIPANAITPTSPYQRNETFNGKTLGRVWQWNHNPDDSKWSLKNGRLRLQSMPAEQLMWARNSLTQRVIGPTSIATVELYLQGLKDGDVAGLGNINVPCSWIGVSLPQYQCALLVDRCEPPPIPLPREGELLFAEMFRTDY